MTLSTEIVTALLVDGFLSGSILLAVAFILRRYTKVILALVLIVAALAYIMFAYRTSQDLGWLLIELGGVAIYGTMGIVGIRRSTWWLVAGWALHPVWDIALHFFGPGHTFAPITYTIPCLSFDLWVAALIAFGIMRGWRAVALQPAAAAI
jgi:hypothetical protein